MRQKQLLIILGVAAVLVALGLGVTRWRAGALEGQSGMAGGKVLPGFPLNEISKIVIVGTTNKATVERKDGKWGVAERWGYPADFERVSEVLRNMWELKSVQKVMAGPSQMGRLELEPPGEGEGKGTLVEFWKEGAKEPIKVIIGKRPANGSGRFVKAAGSDSAWLVSESFYRVTTAPLDWIKRDLPEVGAAKSLSVNGPDGKVIWALSRAKDTDDFKLVGAVAGEEFDEATHGYTAKNPMSYATFSDVVASDTKPSDSGLDKARVVEIKTFDDFTYVLKIGAKDSENRYFAQLSVSAKIPEKREAGKDEKDADKKRLDDEFKKKQEDLKKKLDGAKAMAAWVYKLDESRVSFFLKNRADILKKKEEPKKDEAPKEEPTKVEPPKEESKKAGPVKDEAKPSGDAKPADQMN
ncbi:MAG TPA: DUF4340 domain-containing protein [Verrucomicrobiae bacterium]|nr:DUF4340 domain-containing protein [Verrucomicrobiae bacterium]